MSNPNHLNNRSLSQPSLNSIQRTPEEMPRSRTALSSLNREVLPENTHNNLEHASCPDRQMWNSSPPLPGTQNQSSRLPYLPSKLSQVPLILSSENTDSSHASIVPSPRNNAMDVNGSDASSLAVVPFRSANCLDSMLPQSSSAGGLDPSEGSFTHSSSGAARAVTPHKTAAGALVRVCPACLRPFNDDPIRRPSKFTPQYFRQLHITGPPPLLAIEDGSRKVPTLALLNSTRNLVSPESTYPVGSSSALDGPSPPSTPPVILSPQQKRVLKPATPTRSRGGGIEPLGEATSQRRSMSREASRTRSRRPSASSDVQTGYLYVSPTTSAEPADGPREVFDTATNHRIEEMLAAHQMKKKSEKATSRNNGQSHEFLNEISEETAGSVESYYEKYFLEVKKLGSGSFGGVYLCMHVMEGVALGTFALKKVPVGDDVLYLQNVLREVRILEEVKRHPNVVEYNHSWVDTAKLADFGPPVRCLFILMEYANEGSLDTYLERHTSVLPNVAVWYFFLGAVAGTAHMHQKNILHRDLKPQNLLLSSRTPNAPPRVLVSDFGTAALPGDKVVSRTGGTGTLEYMAPELLIHGFVAPESEEKYLHQHTKSSDVWSLGMILHFLACGGALPKRSSDGSVLLEVQDLSPIPRPQDMVELIRAMLQLNPKKRPSCNDIMRSTVAQTLISSFNNTSFTTLDLFSIIESEPGPPVQIAEEEPAEALESSRVELLSTLVSQTPLLQQYQVQQKSLQSNRGLHSPTTSEHLTKGTAVGKQRSSAYPVTQTNSSSFPFTSTNAALMCASSSRKEQIKSPALINNGSMRSLVTPPTISQKKMSNASVQTDPVTIL